MDRDLETMRRVLHIEEARPVDAVRARCRYRYRSAFLFAYLSQQQQQLLAFAA